MNGKLPSPFCDAGVAKSAVIASFKSQQTSLEKNLDLGKTLSFSTIFQDLNVKHSLGLWREKYVFKAKDLATSILCQRRAWKML